MSEIADVSGANVTELAGAIGCLPKDIRAFTARAEELGRGDSVAFLKELTRSTCASASVRWR